MPKFEMLSDWPFTGQHTIPAGTIVDLANPFYLGIPIPLCMPLSAKALDQAALDHMFALYGPSNEIHCASGLRRP
jgi:hypothetical protein